MFAVIYRAKLLTGKEAEYRRLWHKIATYFVQKRGAIGSCLHQTRDDMWLAYSRWPDKATRDTSWPGDDAPNEALPEDIKQAIIAIKACIAEEYPEICMEVVEDLLLN